MPLVVIKDELQKECNYVQLRHLHSVHAKVVEKLGKKYNLDILDPKLSIEDELKFPSPEFDDMKP